MIKKSLLELQFLVPWFFVLVVLMLATTLHPFNFLSTNGVQWLSGEPGLYFNGRGMALTDRDFSSNAYDAISVELWMQERRGSKNWGPKEIFSLYDGAASPSLLVGQWGGHIFLYSRYNVDEDTFWYKRFRSTKRFPREKPHLVTVTFSGQEQALYIDGALQEKRIREKPAETEVSFSGRLLLGSSPAGNNGWRGEIRGLALYDSVLQQEEIVRHHTVVRRKGMYGLAEDPDCLVLYPFDEGSGNSTASVKDASPALSIPPHTIALVSTLFSLPHKNMRKIHLLGFPLHDFLKNILFFLPFGLILALIVQQKFPLNHFALLLTVAATGGLFSLTIEFLQLFLPSRSADMPDIISNMIGSGLGVFIVYVLQQKKWPRNGPDESST
jgi:VanZ family protein